MFKLYLPLGKKQTKNTSASLSVSIGHLLSDQTGPETSQVTNKPLFV